jgi:hypothetical protein
VIDTDTLTIEFSGEALDTLELIKALTGYSDLTEVVRSSIDTMRVLQERVSAGSRIFVVDPGETKAIELIWPADKKHLT